MEFFNITPLEKCIDILKNSFNFNLEYEEISLCEIVGRVLAEDIYSNFNIPSFNKSTVDGYALNVYDTFGARENTGSLLKVVGSVNMGEIYKGELSPGEAIYVPTGGMIPKNSNGVVMIENTDTLGDEIIVNKSISLNGNIVLEGSEIKKGELIVKKNEKLTLMHIPILSSIGIHTIKVLKKPKFYIISTGDEVVDLHTPLRDGQIYDVNGYIFKGMIEQYKGIVTKKVLINDNLDKLENFIKEGISTSQIVVISGGSSVGVMDYTKKAILNNFGEILVHGINLKPGKPTIIAKCSDKLILGLPGHPQSSIVVFRTILDTIFENKRRYVLGTLSENIFGDPGKYVFIHVKIDSEMQISPIYSKSSMVRPLLESDGYIIIPSHREGLYANEIVKVWLND